jgi:hypothetical protein
MSRLHTVGLFAVAFFALIFGSFSHDSAMAVVIPTSLGSGADSMLARDDGTNGGPFTGDEILGAGTGIQVRANDGTGRNRLGIFRFDTSSLSSVISTDAQLMFHETGNNGRDVTVYGLNDGDAGENWDEAAITYNTAPGISFNNSGAPMLATDFDGARLTTLGTFATTGATDETLSFGGAALETFIDADNDGLLTFYLYQDGGNGNLVFTTKEGGTAPTLNLIPEPASVLLLALASTALAAIRRRR